MQTVSYILCRGKKNAFCCLKNAWSSTMKFCSSDGIGSWERTETTLLLQGLGVGGRRPAREFEEYQERHLGHMENFEYTKSFFPVSDFSPSMFTLPPSYATPKRPHAEPPEAHCRGSGCWWGAAVAPQSAAGGGPAERRCAAGRGGRTPVKYTAAILCLKWDIFLFQVAFFLQLYPSKGEEGPDGVAKTIIFFF